MYSFKPRRAQISHLAAPLLLAALLAGCNQQSAATEKAASASAPAPAASQAASAAAPAVSAASAAAPTEQELAVMKRAQERWDALIARDFERAWTYLEPAEREKIKQENYKLLFGAAGAWKEASVHRVVCGKARCAARTRLVTIMALPGVPKDMPPQETFSDEEWRLEDGQWWYRDAARRQQDAPGEEPLPSAADPIIPVRQPASGPVWGGSRRRAR